MKNQALHAGNSTCFLQEALGVATFLFYSPHITEHPKNFGLERGKMGKNFGLERGKMGGERGIRRVTGNPLPGGSAPDQGLESICSQFVSIMHGVSMQLKGSLLVPL